MRALVTSEYVASPVLQRYPRLSLRMRQRPGHDGDGELLASTLPRLSLRMRKVRNGRGGGTTGLQRYLGSR